MRQVPNYLIIGNGRVATHFCHYLSLLNIPFSTWSRSNTPPLSTDIIHSHQVVLLCISDDSIDSFVQHHKLHEHPLVCHLSAVINVPGISFAHPLMCFSASLYSLVDYQKIPFVIDEDGPSFSEIMPGLPNPAYIIQQSQRCFYHAMCVLGGNLTTLLWEKFFSEMSARMGLEKSLLIPYFEQINKNILTEDNPLTGPLARQDHTTMAAHMETLSDDPFRHLYHAMQTAYSEINHGTP